MGAELVRGCRLALGSASAGETFAWGRRVGLSALPGDAVLLSGPVGAGKSVFADGVLTGAGAPGPHPSPTFTLVREYAGRMRAVHVDLYRLEGGAPDADIGWDDILDGEALAVVEWAEFLGAHRPVDALWVALEPGPACARQLAFLATGPRSCRLMGTLGAAAGGAT